MSRILVLTTDLPYFPGKMGCDHFHLRHLSCSHRVGMVAPCYDGFPKEGVANLEAFLAEARFWPRPPGPAQLFVDPEVAGSLPSWVERIPRSWRLRLLRRLAGTEGRPEDAHEKLAILSNLAPHLCAAIEAGHWDAYVLIQTSIEPWLDYLPASGGKLVYFHDVRSDYLERVIPGPGERPATAKAVAAIRAQEQRVMDRADVPGFVSRLDLDRATRMFGSRPGAGVAELPVDTQYFHPPDATWAREGRRIVLFTGHLSHPPNVDAALHFITAVWPLIREQEPDAVFQAVGMMPAPSIEQAIARTPGCELHANVPDIRPYFWNAAVYVVPMRFGGGVRQKLFEAWSMGVPVVCTTMAAEGTGAVSGRHAWLEDEPKAFADRVVSILRGEDVESIRRSAKAHVEANNSITAAAPRFQQLVERAVAIHRERPFKVLFDLRWMEIGRAGGIEQATYELVSAIGQLDHVNEYRLHAPSSTCSEWKFPRGFRVRMSHSDPAERRLEMLAGYGANRLAEGLGLHPVMTQPMRSLRAINRLDFDIVHSVTGYIHPDLLAHPGVLTMNDLQHVHHPEFFTPQEFEERERLYRTSAEKARHIICISEFTRQDMHRQYGIPLEKMTTVWIIPSRTVWRALAPGESRSILRGMGVEGRFLLFPAHCWPHKNHDRLVEALQLIEGELPQDLKLVMTGRPFPADHPAAQRLRDWKGASRVRHLGFRSPLEIRALIQDCTALVFPSLFEGFGMPVAEAIIAGRPVLCSDVTSLPEIAGEAALTFDPRSAESIARRILELVRDPALERDLSQAAIRRRPKFSARRTTLQTLSVYHRVYRELHGR